MKVSIVTSLYRSQDYVNEFCARCRKSAERIADDFEIILVNDCSPDNSLEKALACAETDSRITVIDLARNFGQHRAIMTGIAHSSGDYVFIADSDLEEDPALLERFYTVMISENDTDVVYGVQTVRKGGLIERLSGSIFYRVFNFLSEVKIPANQITARLMTRRYADALIQHRERELFMAGIWALTGFRQVAVPVRKRSSSPTSYTLKKKISLLINSLTSFSSRPLLAASYIGFVITVSAFAGIIKLVYDRLAHGTAIEGWTSIFVSIWFACGLIVFFVGLIGLYVSRMFTETKKRPYTVIKQIHSFPCRFSRDRIKNTVSEYYSSLVKTHGATPKGADWNSSESQTLRFRQLMNAVENGKPFSINELGCGYGALPAWMKDNGFRFRYTGYDISSEMISEAKKLHSKGRNISFVKSDRMKSADYTVASGIFNVRPGISEREWEAYVQDTIRMMDRSSVKAFAFNALTSYSDSHLMRDDLYYADPLKLFDFCKRNFSKNVSLHHDYGLYEFTIIVRKDI